MSIKGKGSFQISSAWCTATNLRNQTSITYSSELKIALSNYFFGTDVFKRWDGNTWVINSEIKTYDGSQFIEKPLKRWDGENWITVQTTK